MYHPGEEIIQKSSSGNLKNETNGNDGGDNDYHNTSLSFSIRYIHIIAKITDE